MKFDRDEFENFLIYNDCVEICDPPRILANNRESRHYFNVRNVTGTSEKLKILTDFLHAYTTSKVNSFDYYYGVPEGATKIGIIASYRFCNKVVMGRGKVKDHGDAYDKYFVTPPEKGEKPVIVEDTTTTGTSILKEVDKISKVGVDIAAAIVIVNRLEKMGDNITVLDKTIEDELREKGIQLYSMTDASTLLPIYLKTHPQPIRFLKEIEDYSRKYGSRELHLTSD